MKTTNVQQPTTKLIFGNSLIRRLSSLVMFICLASTLSAQLPNWYFFRPSNNGTNTDVVAYFYDRQGNNWSDKYFGNERCLFTKNIWS